MESNLPILSPGLEILVDLTTVPNVTLTKAPGMGVTYQHRLLAAGARLRFWRSRRVPVLGVGTQKKWELTI